MDRSGSIRVPVTPIVLNLVRVAAINLNLVGLVQKISLTVGLTIRTDLVVSTRRSIPNSIDF